MQINGQCHECGRFRKVRVVFDHDLGHYIGMCHECERKRK